MQRRGTRFTETYADYLPPFLTLVVLHFATKKT